jgi:hypothetical protein
LELRFQFRYAPPQQPRMLELNPQTLWFSSVSGLMQAKSNPGRKVEIKHVSQALVRPLRYNQLRQEIMHRTQCSKRTAQLAISQASQQGLIRQEAGQYHLPLDPATGHVSGVVSRTCREKENSRDAPLG